MKSPFLLMLQEQMYLRRYAKRTIIVYLKWTAAPIQFNNLRYLTATGYDDIEPTQKHPENKPKGETLQFCLTVMH
ncbi:integrase [Pseudoalteromonas rubra]|uniref:Integrase n=1 Tax=Pseudoalteromonas rubra TaxID=43658 RepID=A0A4Q7EKY0_9GAMM|nr:integrase [Pseudoalteromonas rubra]